MAGKTEAGAEIGSSTSGVEITSCSGMIVGETAWVSGVVKIAELAVVAVSLGFWIKLHLHGRCGRLHTSDSVCQVKLTVDLRANSVQPLRVADPHSPCWPAR